VSPGSEPEKLSLLDEIMLLTVPETDWAWLACAIDGEGNIKVYHQEGRHYQASLRVFNTNRSFIEKAAELTLENVKGKSGDTPLRTKTCWYIQVTKVHKLLYILKKVLPYLIIKKRLAELVIRFCEVRMSNVHYTGEEEEIAKECVKAMAECRSKQNKYTKKEVGISAPTGVFL
jgi:hypothetical protein